MSQLSTPAARVTSSPPGGRLRELDSLRGIAAVSVLLFHLSFWTDPGNVMHWPLQLTRGHYGVELFFVISGFVILMTLERSGNVKDFVISRLTRLYPAFWCGVLFTTFVLLATPPRAPAVCRDLGCASATLVVNLTMLQEFFNARDVDPSYWTLSYELVFYAWMIIWFQIRTPGRARIEWCCLAWLAATALTDVILHLRHLQVPEGIGRLLIFHYSQFFIIGICLYRMRSAQGRPSPLPTVTLLCAVALSLFGGGPLSQNPGPLQYFLVTCAVTGLVWVALYVRPRLLRNPVLLFLGDISYPLYLIHQEAGAALLAFARPWCPIWLPIPLVLLFLIAVAWLIHRCVEVPGRTVLRARLRQWWSATPATT